MTNLRYAVVDLHPPLARSEEAPDSYEDFPENFPEDERRRLHGSLVAIAHGLGVEEPSRQLLVSASGSGYDSEAMDAADAYKLSVASVAPAHGIGDIASVGAFGFGGDDSNMRNVVERERHNLRQAKLTIVQELAAADSEGILTEEVRQAARIRLQELDGQIAELGTLQAQDDHKVPVYYATPFDGLLEPNPEDNPLAYLPDTGEPGFLAAFGRDSLQTAGIPVTEKSDTQIRIAGSGRVLMRHCVFVVRV